MTGPGAGPIPAGREARALAIRDHLLRALLDGVAAGRGRSAGGGVAVETDYFRLVLQRRPAWAPVPAPWTTRLTVWARLPGSSPGALARVLAVAWDEEHGAPEVGLFRRGAWEGDALSLRLPPARGR